MKNNKANIYCFYSDIIEEDEEDESSVRSFGGHRDPLTASNGEEVLCNEEGEEPSKMFLSSNGQVHLSSVPPPPSHPPPPLLRAPSLDQQVIVKMKI